MLVSIILPTFNEKGNILKLIDAIHDELQEVNHEIVVVDDASTDGTYQSVKEKKDGRVKLILRQKQPSLAGSIRDGIEGSKGDVIVVMDSDFNHQPKYLPCLITNLQFYDVVTASRFVYGGSMESRFRHLLSWVFNIFVRIMTGKYITDSLYGYYAIHRHVLEKIPYEDVFWGFGDYGIRLFYYLQVNEQKILQIPAVNGQRISGQSNRRFIGVFCQYFIATCRLVIKERLKKL